MVWNYVVNNYLLGKKPPAFDVLYWNQDTVRLAAGLHRDFIRLALDNTLTRPGAMDVLGSPVDLAAIGLDSYVVAGLSDHIVPWQSAYRSMQLLGGEQLSAEQWEHFLRTRRFVDEEVLPVINDYWERAELPWPLFERLADLGLVGEGIEGYGCPGMSPLACGLVHMELHRGDGSL